MSNDPRCDAVRAQLEEAFWSRLPLAAGDTNHFETCAACRTYGEELGGLGAQLASPEFAVSESVSARALGRARAALAVDGQAPPLPIGYGREFARLLIAALLPLPIVLAWNAALFNVVGDVLAGFVPELLLRIAAGGYVITAVGWAALLFGSIPFLAHRRATQSALR